MFIAKEKRIAEYDLSLLGLQRAADCIGYDLTSDPQWGELNQMVTNYDVGEIRHSPAFRTKFYTMRREIGKRMGY